MRRLWITREPAVAAGTAKMKVYVEDPENGDTFIRDTLCRKLGELKNDQQKHFAIGEEPSRIFVTGGKLSRNVSCEVITIPGGREDVFLSGRNYFRPFAGNPFRFDGNTEVLPQETPRETLRETPREMPRKTRKGGKGILIAIVILGILGGIGAGVAVSTALLGKAPVQESRVYGPQGMQIAMGEAFEAVPAEGYAACYANAETVVRILREDFSLQEGLESLTLTEYKDRVFANNGLDDALLKEEGEDRTTFSYTWADPNTAERYAFYSVLMKGPDAFWMVQFSAPQKDAKSREAVFQRWAETIVLDAR